MRLFEGVVWRHVPVGAEALHLGWILKGARGRWNTKRPRLPCLHTSLSRIGAICEFDKHKRHYAAPVRRDLVSLHVAVGPVLDLTNPRVRGRVDVSLDTILSDGTADVAACRRVARMHVLDGPYQAILAPSAACPSETNLMVFLASTRGIRELRNGSDRLTLS